MHTLKPSKLDFWLLFAFLALFGYGLVQLVGTANAAPPQPYVKKGGDQMTGRLTVPNLTINGQDGGVIFPDGTIQRTAASSSGGGSAEGMWMDGLWARGNSGTMVGVQSAEYIALGSFNGGETHSGAGTNPSNLQLPVTQHVANGVGAEVACGVQGTATLKAAWLPQMRILFQTPAAAGARTFVGFANGYQTAIDSDTPTVTTVAFRCHQGTDTNWQAVAAHPINGQLTADTGVPCVQSEFREFHVRYTAETTVEYLIDGELVATISGSQVNNSTSESLEAFAGAKSTAAADVAIACHSIHWGTAFQN